MTLEQPTSVRPSQVVIPPDLNPHTRLADALKPVADNLEELNSRIAPLTGAQTSTAKDVVNHVLAAGGKRVRPALYFLAARLVNYSGEHLYNMAAVCEFVHTASLLHDDVIDNSTLRRNKPTSNAIWGDECSVLTGDLIYARASEMMAATGSLEIVSMFAKSIRLMSEGELLQLEHLYNPNMTDVDIFTIIEHKTATLLASACRAAAVLGNRSEIECSALEKFGSSVGYAFQLLDDSLDFAGTPEIFGKKTLSDLPEGKVTLPVVLLRSQASSDEWSKVEKIIRKIEISAKDMQYVQSLVDQYDTAGQTLELASQYTVKAIDALQVFPPSKPREELEMLANSLLLRVQ